MKGDFTRSTYKRDRHYSSVRMQQGRVQMDADWNEQLDIQAHRERTEMIDVIGRCGVPEGEGGFRVYAINADAGGHGASLGIEPGRIYVDGILCELEPSRAVTLEGDGGSGGLSDWRVDSGPLLHEQQWVRVVGGAGDGDVIQVQSLTPGNDSDPRVTASFDATELAAATGTSVTVEPLTSYRVQPDLPTPAATSAGVYFAYLDVWERHITALDDPAIREVALGGPDTATRVRTVWQVRLERTDDSDADCADLVGWVASTGQLAARAQPGEDASNPCIIPAEAGYRRLENQLYRVEIHDDGSVSGTPTFKWSRDNGSLAMRLVAWDSANDSITVSHPRSDALSRIATNDWVEVLDDDMLLRGEPGIFIQIGEINGNQLAIKDNPSGATLPQTGIVRRWEGGAPIDVTTADWIALESGVQVRFDGGTLHSGDYWTIPARTITHDVEWPRDESSGDPHYLAPQGVAHHSCALAVVELDAAGDWQVLRDCRESFPPLTDLPLGGCCLRIDPGDDLQRAIDSVIRDGGGCICLGAGVHEHRGVLRIAEANGLDLHGEGTATVLRLLADDDGNGGVLLFDCHQVNLSGMCLVGDGIDAVVRTESTALLAENDHIRLRDLVVLNATLTDQKQPRETALQLANARDLVIEDCTLIAANGIVAKFGDLLPFYVETGPFSTKYGYGLQRVDLHNVAVRFARYGLWTLRSDDWHIDDCTIRSTDIERLAGAMDKVRSSTNQQLARQLPGVVQQLVESSVATNSGTAIRAFVWRRCEVQSTALAGRRGLEACWYLRNTLADCRIDVGEVGLHTDWHHDSLSRHCRYTSDEGLAITFVGSYRARIADNHVRTRIGVANLPWQRRLFDFLEYVQEVADFYPAMQVDDDTGEDLGDAFGEWLAFWMLLRETMAITGLSGLVGRCLDAVVPPAMKSYAYFVFASMLYYWLLEYREAQLESGETNETGLAAVALTIGGNDIETEHACLRIEKLFLMGGGTIAHNRLHAAAARAVLLDATPVAANVHLVNALWQYGFKELIENRVPAWRANLQASGNAAWLPALDELLELLQSWLAGSESFMEADYRIDGNAVRSQGTAISSNLWELAVARNHITLREQGIGVTDGVNIFEALREEDATRPLAYAVREGSHAGIEEASRGLAREELLADREVRSGAAEAMFAVSARVTDAGVREYANAAGVALNTGDRAGLSAVLERLIEVLVASTGSHGILLRNPGCRVIDNHVLVPLDTEPLSWARGGITVTTLGGEGDQGLASLQMLGLLALFGFELAFDPVVGVTETLIADNEVVGGFGHGIHINTPMVFGQLRWGLSDIHIAGNQIRGMGGAGVVVSEESFAVGVDVLDNQVIDCSSRILLAGFTADKGGVVIRNSGICRLRGNRVVRCATGLQENLAFGVLLDTVLGLQIDDNQILSNGSADSEVSGGIYLKTVLDGVSLHSNRFDRNRGFELYVLNDYDVKEIPAGLLTLVDLYGRRDDAGDVRPSAINVADNRMHARQRLCYVSDVGEFTFSGNQVVMTFRDTANFSRIGTGIFAHNKVLMTGIEGSYSLNVDMDRGTVVGNVCDAAILVRAPAGASIEHGLNIPQVSRVFG